MKILFTRRLFSGGTRLYSKGDLWRNCFNRLLPWRVRVAVWNWCFDSNLDWRQRKSITRVE